MDHKHNETLDLNSEEDWSPPAKSMTIDVYFVCTLPIEERDYYFFARSDLSPEDKRPLRKINHGKRLAKHFAIPAADYVGDSRPVPCVPYAISTSFVLIETGNFPNLYRINSTKISIRKGPGNLMPLLKGNFDNISANQGIFVPTELPFPLEAPRMRPTYIPRRYIPEGVVAKKEILAQFFARDGRNTQSPAAALNKTHPVPAEGTNLITMAGEKLSPEVLQEIATEFDCKILFGAEDHPDIPTVSLQDLFLEPRLSPQETRSGVEFLNFIIGFVKEKYKTISCNQVLSNRVETLSEKFDADSSCGILVITGRSPKFASKMAEHVCTSLGVSCTIKVLLIGDEISNLVQPKDFWKFNPDLMPAKCLNRVSVLEQLVPVSNFHVRTNTWSSAGANNLRRLAVANWGGKSDADMFPVVDSWNRPNHEEPEPQSGYNSVEDGYKTEPVVYVKTLSKHFEKLLCTLRAKSIRFKTLRQARKARWRCVMAVGTMESLSFLAEVKLVYLAEARDLASTTAHREYIIKVSGNSTYPNEWSPQALEILMLFKKVKKAKVISIFPFSDYFFRLITEVDCTDLLVSFLKHVNESVKPAMFHSVLTQDKTTFLFGFKHTRPPAPVVAEAQFLVLDGLPIYLDCEVIDNEAKKLGFYSVQRYWASEDAGNSPLFVLQLDSRKVTPSVPSSLTIHGYTINCKLTNYNGSYMEQNFDHNMAATALSDLMDIHKLCNFTDKAKAFLASEGNDAPSSDCENDLPDGAEVLVGEAKEPSSEVKKDVTDVGEAGASISPPLLPPPNASLVCDNILIDHVEKPGAQVAPGSPALQPLQPERIGKKVPKQDKANTSSSVKVGGQRGRNGGKGRGNGSTSRGGGYRSNGDSRGRGQTDLRNSFAVLQRNENSDEDKNFFETHGHPGSRRRASAGTRHDSDDSTESGSESVIDLTSPFEIAKATSHRKRPGRDPVGVSTPTSKPPAQEAGSPVELSPSKRPRPPANTPTPDAPPHGSLPPAGIGTAGVCSEGVGLPRGVLGGVYVPSRPGEGQAFGSSETLPLSGDASHSNSLDSSSSDIPTQPKTPTTTSPDTEMASTCEMTGSQAPMAACTSALDGSQTSEASGPVALPNPTRNDG